MQALSVRRVRKRYEKTLALDDVSLEIASGESVGLLGPNGAGKTTLLEIICGLRKADFGEVHAFGEMVAPDNKDVWRRMAIALPAASLPRRARVGELVTFYQQVYRRTESVADVLAQVGLADCEMQFPLRMSSGQKQRLSLALTLIGNPDLLVLDEPTSELDPHGRRKIWELIGAFRAETGRSVLLATHHMDEAATLCGKVGIMLKGQIVAYGPPSELIARYCPDSMLVVRTSLPEPPVLATATLHERRGEMAHYRTENLASAMAELIAAIPATALKSVEVVKPTLEDVFFAVTGEVLDA